jgi:hypothetical protein
MEVVMSKTDQNRLRGFMAVVVLVASLVAGAGVSQAAVEEQMAVTGLWVTPLEIDFGPVGLGSTSVQAVVTITNYSALPLNGFAGGGVYAPFHATQDCASGIAPGGHCHYYFTFSPTAEGEFSSVSSSSSSLGNFKINVHGTGVGAKVVYDAHSLDMGSVVIGGDATQQTVTLRNVGLAPLADFAGGAPGAPFSAGQDCNIAGGILPGNSCHYNFNFSPTAVGTFTTTSSSSTNGGPVSIDVKGSGRSYVFGGGQRVSPLALDFGPVGVGMNSAQLKTEIHNQKITLNTPTPITGFAGGGVNLPFHASQDCADGVPQGESCYFYYTFTPSAAGEFTATSNVSDSFGSFSIQLHGTGVAPSKNVTPLWLDFGPVTLNTTSPIQTVTITNTGLSPISGWAGGGVGAPFSGSQDCVIEGGLLPGNSCHFNYRFNPTASGFFTARPNVSSNAGSFTVLLQGGPHPAEYSLGVNFPGTGRGTVSSSPTGINCNTDCSGMYTAGAPVVLSAAAAEFSVFSGWSGICNGTGTCAVTADADKSVIATFTIDTDHRARIGASYFPTLTLAYAGASSVGNVIIEASATEFIESLSCNGTKNVTLKGGYKGNYSSNSDGYTTLKGVLTVGKGSLAAERLIIL